MSLLSLSHRPKCCEHTGEMHRVSARCHANAGLDSGWAVRRQGAKMLRPFWFRPILILILIRFPSASSRNPHIKQNKCDRCSGSPLLQSAPPEPPRTTRIRATESIAVLEGDDGRCLPGQHFALPSCPEPVLTGPPPPCSQAAVGP